VELVLLAAVLAATILLASWSGIRAPLLACLALLCGCLLGATLLVAADKPKNAEAAKRPEGTPAVKKLVRPKAWPAEQPLPTVGSNCASCHLTAGRELTAAVVNFVRSAHDLQEMTCYDCHGGNSVDDVKAHTEEFEFIGTKKSAHIATCSACHDEAAEVLSTGPHHWDFGQRINTEYPMCVDCHGNHDIGNPPADFKLSAMCADCHDSPDKEFPQLASVVTQNDKLWDTLRQVRKRRIQEQQPIPEKFQAEVAKLRAETMQLVHASKEIPAEKAAAFNKRVESLRLALDGWLQSKP